MCPKRNTTDARRRRPSPSGMTIDELNSSELVALLNAETPSSSTTWAESILSSSLSATFMVITFVITTLFAFSVGCAARIHILSHHGMAPPSIHTEVQAHGGEHNGLPSPTILPGKEVPYTTYTSKHFQMPGSSTSNTLHIDRSDGIQRGEGSYAPPTKDGRDMSELKEAEMNEHGHNTDESGEHLPAGQHLLLDFKDVDSDFLNSEERLAKAMIELTNESGLTLLSYHCHSLVPIGVSCAGVLLESHVAFHTWPLEGVIAMDLFTCGGGLLIPLLPLVKKLFAVPRVPELGEDPQDIPEPSMLWSHKWRGFRHGYDPNMEEEEETHQYQCMDRWVLGRLDFDIKEPVVSTRTKFQAYDVYELMNPEKRDIMSYQKSLEDDDSYESRNPELFGPDRVLFLDGVSQSTRFGDASYHESIVHPAMIAHDNPERVAIIGGGEGATMREVLKHKSVKKAVMIEIDDEIVGLSKEYLPGWNDCSNIEGSAAWCFDDVRAEPRYEDAMAFFVDRYYDAASTVEKFDVIIMDALDPNDGVEFATHLYTDDAYMHSLYNGLSGSGILVVQVGEIPVSKSPPDEFGPFKNRALMMQQLEEIGFKSIHLYDEGHSEFHAPWSTLVAFKDERTRNNWYRNSAEIDLQIKKRISKSTTGKPLLRNFDGSTMMGYQITPKVFQSQYCNEYKAAPRLEGAPAECLDKKFLSSEQAYNPVLDRSSSPRQSRHHNFFEGNNGRSNTQTKHDAAHLHQLPSKTASEKFSDGAALFFKVGDRLATCEAESTKCE